MESMKAPSPKAEPLNTTHLLLEPQAGLLCCVVWAGGRGELWGGITLSGVRVGPTGFFPSGQLPGRTLPCLVTVGVALKI